MFFCLGAMVGCGGGNAEKAFNPVGNANEQGGANLAANPDTVAPTVVSTDPKDAQVLTTPLASVHVDFSEPMDPDSVKASFQLKQFKITIGGAGGPSLGGFPSGPVKVEGDFVPVAVGEPIVTKDGQSFEFPITAPLPKGNLKIVVSTSAKDRNQNPLAENFNASFKIAPESAGEQVEAPTIVILNPGNGEEKLPRQVGIFLQFDQPMSAAKVISNFSLNKVDTDFRGNTKEEKVDGTLTPCSDQKTFIFQPLNLLDRSQKYLTRIGAGAESLAGISLAHEVTAGFETKFTIFGAGGESCPDGK